MIGVSISSLGRGCVLTPHCINIRHAGPQYQHLAGAHWHRGRESAAHCSTEPWSPGHHMQLQTETRVHGISSGSPADLLQVCCQGEVGTSTWHQPGQWRHNSSASRLQTNTNIIDFVINLVTRTHISTIHKPFFHSTILLPQRRVPAIS